MFINVSEFLAASIMRALMIEAATTKKIACVHGHCHENLKF
jgi:hypothetical protein